MKTDSFLEKSFLNEISDREDFFLQAFEQSFNAVVITEALLDRPGPRILYANQAFLQQTGYTKEEISGETPRILQGEKTDWDVIKYLRKTIEKGEFFQGKTFNYRKDGTEYLVEWNISSIKNDKGEIQYYLCMQRDITNSYLLEKEMEENVLQKTKLNSMGDMISVIAHQWSQPINALGLMVQNIQFDYKEGDLSEDSLDKTVEDSMAQLNYMSETIKVFTSYFKQEREKSHFLVKKIVQTTLRLISSRLKQQSITTEVIGEENIHILGFPNEFKQVVLNLINNSIDAISSNNIKDGKITIKISNKNDTIHIEIIDNGGGIPEEILKKVFDPYFTTKGDKGTGIGLNMCKMIIEDHLHGTIQGKNTDNGAMFLIMVNNVSQE